MSLLFYAADTLHTTLHQLKDGRVVGKELRKIPFGPWQIDVLVDVQSDFVKEERLSFWVTIEHLHLYVVLSTADNDDKSSLWLVLFNTDKLEKVRSQGGFTADTLKGRLAEIKPLTKDVFQWTSKDFWHKVQTKAS